MFKRIVGPANLHFRDAMNAFEQGQHVLCDPPLADTDGHCEEMIQSASDHNCILMAAHRFRFRPEYQHLQEFATYGKYGSILTATFIRHCATPVHSSGDSLLNFLIDPIDQALMMFGVPSQVSCKRFAGPETAMATLVYRSGPEIRVQGGWLPMPVPLTESFQVRAQKAELNFSREGLVLNDSSGARHALEVRSADAEADMTAYFKECCHTQQQPQKCLPASSALAVRVALLLKQSREMGGQPLECKV